MAVAIKLKDMSIFEAYAGRMRHTAQLADAKQITPDQITASAKSMAYPFITMRYQYLPRL